MSKAQVWSRDPLPASATAQACLQQGRHARMAELGGRGCRVPSRGRRALSRQKRAERVFPPSWRRGTKSLATPPPPPPRKEERQPRPWPSRAGWGVSLPRQQERKQAVITGHLPAALLAASLRARRAWPRGIRVSNCPDLFLHLSRPRGGGCAALLCSRARLSAEGCQVTWPDPLGKEPSRRGTASLPPPQNKKLLSQRTSGQSCR